MTNVYSVSKSETLERKNGSVKNPKLDLEEFNETAHTNNLKSMKGHTIDLGDSHQNLQRAIKKCVE
uniref:Uncharacterized protein n=1 Tax=Lepeophtheirus salmonis TaxID=72036 RepID=A0A0K2T0A3_LEPSM